MAPWGRHGPLALLNSCGISGQREYVSTKCEHVCLDNREGVEGLDSQLTGCIMFFSLDWD